MYGGGVEVSRCRHCGHGRPQTVEVLIPPPDTNRPLTVQAVESAADRLVRASTAPPAVDVQ